MSLRIIAALAFSISLLTAPAQAVDEKYKAGWEAAFDYIESSFTEGILLDTALGLTPKWVPYISQAKKILARAANNLEMRLKPLGIDSTKYAYKEFDGVQVVRVAYALEYAQRAKLPAVGSAELLAYGLCPWMVPQCMAEVKAAIYTRRGWKV